MLSLALSRDSLTLLPGGALYPLQGPLVREVEAENPAPPHVRKDLMDLPLALIALSQSLSGEKTGTPSSSPIGTPSL